MTDDDKVIGEANARWKEGLIGITTERELEKEGGRLIPDAFMGEVERIVGSYGTSYTYRIAVMPDRPPRKWPLRIRLRARWSMWRNDAKWWLHDRFFGVHD